jgi:hypothetical protein
VDSPRQAQIQIKTLNAAINAELGSINNLLMMLFKDNGTILYEDWFIARVIQRASTACAASPQSFVVGDWITENSKERMGSTPSTVTVAKMPHRIPARRLNMSS